MRGGGCFGGRRLKQQDRQDIRIKCNNGNETLMETNDDDDDGLLNKIPRDIQSTSLSSFPHTCPTAFLSLYSSDN